MLIVEKSYELFDYVGGDLFVDQYWNTFFLTSEKNYSWIFNEIH